MSSTQRRVAVGVFQKISGFGWVWVFTAPVWVGFRFLFFEKPGFRLGFGFFQNFNKFIEILWKILIKKNVRNKENLSIHRIFCKKFWFLFFIKKLQKKFFWQNFPENFYKNLRNFLCKITQNKPGFIWLGLVFKFGFRLGLGFKISG